MDVLEWTIVYMLLVAALGFICGALTVIVLSKSREIVRVLTYVA